MSTIIIITPPPKQPQRAILKPETLSIDVPDGLTHIEALEHALAQLREEAGQP